MPSREELAGGVVESTFNWYWLIDVLQTEGFNGHLANTVAIKKYEGLKHSGDETDAHVGPKLNCFDVTKLGKDQQLRPFGHVGLRATGNRLHAIND